MITKQESLLDFLGAPHTRFVIPVYQRVYSWGEQQCGELWADVLRAGRSGGSHFVGTILYAPETDEEAGIERRSIIDGQQRITTAVLLIAALADYLEDTGAQTEGTSAQQLTRRYVLAEEGGGEPCKLVPSRADRATFEGLLGNKEMPENEDDISVKVIDNFRFFREKMEGNDFDALKLYEGLQRLFVITAVLEDDDRPQIVFESLNSKGMPLSTTDLVRNLLLVNIPYDEQALLYRKYWEPIERMFSGDTGATRFNAALHGWLAIKAPRLSIARKDDVYATFKTYLADEFDGTIEYLLEGLKGFCETFVRKTQSSGTKQASAHANWANSRVEGIISEKKLFGE